MPQPHQIVDAHGVSPLREQLLALVGDISAVLAEGADGSEDSRALAAASVSVLRDSGLFAALTPANVGGFQVDPVTEMELIEAVSAIDGSTGWSFWASAGSTARVASMLPREAVAEIFDPRRAAPVFAFQERPFGNVARCESAGLRVSGRWPFGTGVAHADWVVAVSAPAPGDRPTRCPPGDLLAAAVPRAQVQVLDTWDASGLSGTGTFDYAIDDVLVGWDRVWAYPPGPALRGGPHFGFRRAPIKHMGFALGVAASSLAVFTEHVGARVGTAREPHGAVVADVARCTLRLAAARALAFETVRGVWDQARRTGGVAPSSQEYLRAVARYVTEVAVEVCCLVMRHGDASLLGRQHRLQRNLRDITAAAAHAEMNHAAVEELGKTLLGQPRSAAAGLGRPA